MLFNSLEFALFLPSVFLLYWFGFRRSVRAQNLFLLAASYLFYGWWDWRFLGLIILSSTVDFVVGLRLASESRSRARKVLLGCSVGLNLSLLGFFKYFDFFSLSLAEALSGIGVSVSPLTLNLVLPVGISFYTFQTLSYTIDIYREKIEPTRDVVAFFAFVAFFPQLVAGPIERASNLLPQFASERKFEVESAVDGVRQILWGLFKKIVVADTCGFFADEIFEHYATLGPSTLVLGVVYFSIQIYGDFSGYSDIAIGTARLFGFSLMRNFANPYFSRDIAEFWRRWHISLSTWFRDYLYIPLGGSRVGKARAIRNIIVIFAVSGFWHGANWTFIAWGVLNGLYFVPLFLLRRNRRYLDVVAPERIFPSVREALQMSATFAVTLIAWVFFRAPTLRDALGYLNGLVDSSWLTTPDTSFKPLVFILVMMAWEWVMRARPHALEISHMKPAVRMFLYIAITTLIVWFGQTGRQFIYFQF